MASVVTVAGTNESGFIDADGVSARFCRPQSMARRHEPVTNRDTLIICDTGNDRLCSYDVVTHRVSTLVGGKLKGAGKLSSPAGVCVLPDQSLLVTSDKDHTITQVKAVSAGDFCDWIERSGRFDCLIAVLWALIGEYLVECNLEVIAGITGRHGMLDGDIDHSMLNSPSGIVCDSDGTSAYIADTHNHRIRRMHLSPHRQLVHVETFAGNGQSANDDRSISSPVALAYAPARAGRKAVLYISSGSLIRSIELDRRWAASIDTVPTQALYPTGIDVTSTGHLLVSSAMARGVFMIDPVSGATELIAGAGAIGAGFADGSARDVARFAHPSSLAVMEHQRTAYVIDQYNHCIRSLLPLPDKCCPPSKSKPKQKQTQQQTSS